jgi:CRP-like cAMP-binding protein
MKSFKSWSQAETNYKSFSNTAAGKNMIASYMTRSNGRISALKKELRSTNKVSLSPPFITSEIFRAFDRNVYRVPAGVYSLQIDACNLFHVIENRLARLLLMFQQRSQSDEINITQDQLAKMLGVRRVGVTKAAGSLQRKNLISYIRGSVIIHDIAGLKKASCGCYEADNATYNNMM